MEGKRFSQVINWDKHIEPYSLIQFVAGVGSGKNYWVEHTLMQNKRVLLITSRKAKVKETSHKLGIASKLNLNAFNNRDLGCLLEDDKKKYQNCVCNNSHIEKYWKYQFNPNDEKTFLWKYFDVIVVDEAHSLATDATFSDAPFHLYSFLNYVFKLKSVKLIFMTATPEPILDIVHTENKQGRKLWNFTKECINILPNKIHIDVQENILQEITSLYQQPDNKVIYFVNHIDSMKILVNQLLENGIPEHQIAVSYSKSGKTIDLPKKIKDSKKETERYLKEHEDLPEDKYILISTSRNKEGINIDNPNVHWYMYVESHYNDECNQMWGRARSGLEKFTIDFMAHQHPRIYCEGEPNYLLSLNGIKCATQTLEDWCNKHQNKLPNYQNTYKDVEYVHLCSCIKEIEARMDFLRYDVIKREFVKYREKEIGCQNHASNITNFEKYVKMRLGKTSELAMSPFKSLRCVINPCIARMLDEPVQMAKKQIKQELIKYFHQEKILKQPSMTEEDEEKLRDFIFQLGITQANGKRYISLKRALEPYGFSYKKGHHKGDLGRIVTLDK